MPHQNPRLSRLLSALLASQLLLSAVPAPLLAAPAVAPATQANLQQPGFEPPRATDCKRPARTHEVAGRPHTAADIAVASGKPVPRSRAPGVARDALAKSAPPATTMAMESSSVTDAAVPMPAPATVPGSALAPEVRQSSTVTAGMVDDNADFSEYLAFRARTGVPHRARDVSERYLLEVKDRTGRGVPDAEVELRSPGGGALRARTDTAGRVWLHPDAFDATRSALYEVSVRHAGRSGLAVLQRGQKSAVQVQLDGQVQAQRARLDLVFLIDATGSMADEIQKLKSSLHSIAADAARLPSRPDLCFGLVAYRDTTDPFVLRSHDLTDDLRAFQRVLDQLQADGGGDYPEAMGEALHETVHRLSWRGEGATRMVVLLADAPPQLGPDRLAYDDAMMVALGKGIKIFSVGASGLDPQGEFVQRQIAQFTGGRFVFLTYDRAGQPASGPGRETEHDVKNYSVATLDQLIVRLIREELGRLPAKAS